MDNPFIRKLERYSPLAPEQRTALEDVARRQVRTIPAREDVIQEGDDPRHVHIILEGWACRYKQLADGRRGIVSLFLPGDLCDPDIVLLTRMDHGIGTLTPATVARVSPDMFDDAVIRPILTRCFRREMLVSLAIQREWCFGLGQRSALERLAHLLCEVHSRLHFVGRVEGMTCDWPVTQIDLADALGLTSVHVNRTLQDLRSAGLITLRGRQLTILDHARLMQTAVFDATYLHGELEAGSNHT